MTNCKGYRLPMIAGVLQYPHIFREDSGHPMQDTLSRTRGVLNEEVGEFSLAHLSRLLPHAITRSRAMLLIERIRCCRVLKEYVMH